MEITGIICEYNPFHNGHRKQFALIREKNPQAGIVCLMSGNYVQRGAPAILDKSLRAKAAVLSGADLVLELPITACLSSAEGFAAEGVRILSGFCSCLCFGAETGTAESLVHTAQKLLSPDFSQALRTQLDKGLSFPAARQAALGDDTLTRPNDILAVEYCKAILSQGSSMTPLVVRREGDYHDQHPEADNPSATAIRRQMLSSEDYSAYVPEAALGCFKDAALHRLKNGEGAILGKLRAMTEAEFAALPYGSEGLWRKLMHAVHSQSTLEQILTSVKSKRYTRTRLDRMVMCAFLGISQEILSNPAPYARVLAFNDRGREILKAARAHGDFPNAGESTGTDYELLEHRCGALYGLFSNTPEPPDTENTRRVVYVK